MTISSLNQLARVVAHNFNAAATSYDDTASVQMRTAGYLVDWAGETVQSPHEVLDLGTGTGFVALAASEKWPRASLTALDPSPAMLNEAKHKILDLKTVIGDAANITFDTPFDAIFSNMVLHWLPQPRTVLKLWQSWLRPQGRLYVATLIEKSFQEWQHLCWLASQDDGLWEMPPADFADGLAVRSERQRLTVTHTSAHSFLRHLKGIGAATPHPGHKPMGAGTLRKLFDLAPEPFEVTYEVLYIEIQSADSI